MCVEHTGNARIRITHRAWLRNPSWLEKIRFKEELKMPLIRNAPKINEGRSVMFLTAHLPDQRDTAGAFFILYTRRKHLGHKIYFSLYKYMIIKPNWKWWIGLYRWKTSFMMKEKMVGRQSQILIYSEGLRHVNQKHIGICTEFGCKSRNKSAMVCSHFFVT